MRGVARIVSLGALVFLLLPVAPARAISITVNTPSNELNDDGDCSLREAVQSANTDSTSDMCTVGSGTDTVVIPAGTYALTGELSLSSPMTLDGAGGASTFLDGGDATRVLSTSSTVTVQELAVQNGNAGEGAGIQNTGTLTLIDGVVTSNSGGCCGGGIHNTGTLGLTDTDVTNNTSHDALIVGTGIYNNGPLTIEGGTISGNDATANGGGMWVAGGMVTITSTTITDNDATGTGSGAAVAIVGGNVSISDSEVTAHIANNGALNNQGGTLTLTDTTVSGNSGGGIYNHTGTLNVTGSTIFDNDAFEGAGIQTGVNGTSTIQNSTISTNDASQNGGGIFNSGTTTLENSTVSGNGAPFGAGGIHVASGTVNIGGSIVANSTNGGGDGDCSGTITSTGHNLFEGACSLTGDTTGNITGLDPMLDDLGDNGGPTETHAPLPGSPAIDGGSPSCPPPSVDQRGIGRPQGPACDIGAFETTPPSSSIGFPPDGSNLQGGAFAAGCGGATPDVCGGGDENPDGAGLDTVEVRIQRAGDGMFWNGASWQPGEDWNPAAGALNWSYGFAPAEGTYTLSSRATDVDGYVEATAMATFTVDDTAPDTTFTKRPKKKMRTERHRKRVRFVLSSEEGSTFECSLDGKAWAPCDPRFSKKVKPGKHRMQARATDLAGNTDPTPAVWRFRVKLES